MGLLMAATALALAKVLVYLGWLHMPALAALSWWWVVGAFALVLAWWSYSDASGRTERLAAERDAARKAHRLAKQKEHLSGGKKRR